MKWLLLFSFLCSKAYIQNAYSQTIQGNITAIDDKRPLPRASITLYTVDDNRLIKFTFSDLQGNFSLDVSDDKIDTLLLHVKFLGYETFKTRIHKESQMLKISLESIEISLKEVKIKPNPIVQLGDTLAYDISEFRNTNDKVLADVLKKLPGVVVGPEGKIIYNGKPINKFYIEGLDLLEGKYNLATRNLPLDAVSQVNIIQNHQPIQALKELEFVENAAVNIRLKKDVALTGLANVGVSHNLKYTDVKLSPMLFTKKRQAISTSSFNNAGKDLLNDFRNFDFEYLKQTQKLAPKKQDLLAYQRISSPPLNNDRTFFNKSFAQSLNYLNKLSNDFQIKVNTSGIWSEQILKSNNSTQFFLESSTKNQALINEQNNKSLLKQQEASMDLLKNTEAFYLKNKTNFTLSNENNIAQNTDKTTGSIYTTIQNPYTLLSNTLNLVFNVRKTYKINVFSDTFLCRNKQNLNSLPSPIFYDSLKLNSIQQTYANPHFVSLNSASIYTSYKNLKFEHKFSSLYEKQKLNSALAFEDAPILNARYNNQIHWNKYNYELNNNLIFNAYKVHIKADFGLNYYKNKIDDKERSLAINEDRWTFEPSLFLSTKLPSRINFMVSGNIKNKFGNISDIYRGNILTSFSMLTRNNGRLNFSKVATGYLSVNYKNILDFFVVNAAYTYSKIKNDLIQSSVFLDNGGIENQMIELDNLAYNQFISLDISKYYSKQKLNFKLNSDLSLIGQNQLLQNQLVKVYTKSSSINLSVIKDIKDKLSIEYDYEQRHSLNKIAKEKYNFKQVKNNVSLNITALEGFRIKLNSSYSIYHIAREKQKYYFQDLDVEVPLKNRKIELAFSWSNIFNAKTFYFVNSTKFAQVISSYPIRPSQFMTYINYRF